MTTISNDTGSALNRFIRSNPLTRLFMPDLVSAVNTLQGTLDVAPGVADLTALKAISASDRADKQVRVVKSNGTRSDLYIFMAGDSTSASEPRVVQPTSGTGRWFALGEYVFKAVYDAVYIRASKLATKEVVVALGNSTGSAQADAGWIGATLLACSPVFGNDQAIAGFSVNGSGAVTVDTADDETAEATFVVLGLLA